MRLRSSLQSIVLVPVLGLLLVAGLALYFLVLRTVSDYADASIRSNLASLLVSAVTIADSEVDRQNREGRVEDSSAALLYQLDARMRAWLAREDLNHFSPQDGRAEVSKIFSWYGKDFEKAEGGLPAVLKKYAPVAGEYKVSIKTYNWALNEQ